MSDQQTTVSELKDLMQQFVAERDWQPFHTPKNLSMSLAIEAAELMEHFQWVENPMGPTERDEIDHQGVKEELADVMCYALSFATAMNIDIADAVREKMKKNAQKYPAEQFKGRYQIRGEGD